MLSVFVYLLLINVNTTAATSLPLPFVSYISRAAKSHSVAPNKTPVVQAGHSPLPATPVSLMLPWGVPAKHRHLGNGGFQPGGTGQPTSEFVPEAPSPFLLLFLNTLPTGAF